jgi:hypothetical protein
MAREYLLDPGHITVIDDKYLLGDGGGGGGRIHRVGGDEEQRLRPTRSFQYTAVILDRS